ncbi:hypothetical protein ALC60_04704 [Trachymyrmex zeteki]|uniref:Uncharacterized protein n=1 Tax=Mycetomoellerius zeteki TaxID=64791 RepID=A0A151X7E9_9HYME|nr:hypothetical protein ALC60_04704 [Trachymyrmex zeteki]
MSRSFFSDESSIIGKYDKRAAPPTKGIGTMKNLTELTLQIRTYLAIGGPSEPPSSKRNRGNGERKKKNGGKRILLYSNDEKEKEDKWKKAKEEEGERLFCPSSIFLTMFISERRPHELAEIRTGPRNTVQRPETLRALDNFLEIVKSHFRDASPPSSSFDSRKVEKRSTSSPGGKLKSASRKGVRCKKGERARDREKERGSVTPTTGGENYPESAWGVRPRRRDEPSASEASAVPDTHQVPYGTKTKRSYKRRERRQRIRGYHRTTTVWELRFIELAQNIASRLCGTLATRRFRTLVYIFLFFFFYSL